VHTPADWLKKKKSSHTQSSHRLNLYFSSTTKRAFAFVAQLAEFPSDVREQAAVHAGWAVPHMYMPMSTELGSQQKSFLL
jgi:hypothetical protein